MGNRIKKDDLVEVISGKHKGKKKEPGKRGRVLRVDVERNRVVVEGLMKVKRHQGPTPRNQQGAIIEKEASIHVSNVMLVDTKADKPTRVRFGTSAEGKKIRIAARSGTVMD